VGSARIYGRPGADRSARVGLSLGLFRWRWATNTGLSFFCRSSQASVSTPCDDLGSRANIWSPDRMVWWWRRYDRLGENAASITAFPLFVAAAIAVRKRWTSLDEDDRALRCRSVSSNDCRCYGRWRPRFLRRRGRGAAGIAVYQFGRNLGALPASSPWAGSRTIPAATPRAVAAGPDSASSAVGAVLTLGHEEKARTRAGAGGE